MKKSGYIKFECFFGNDGSRKCEIVYEANKKSTERGKKTTEGGSRQTLADLLLEAVQENQDSSRSKGNHE